jgi:hypothetical protein
MTSTVAVTAIAHTINSPSINFPEIFTQVRNSSLILRIQSNPDKCTKCVPIVRAHATTQRGYAVLRSKFSCWRVLKQLMRILCTYPGSTVHIFENFLFSKLLSAAISLNTWKCRSSFGFQTAICMIQHV